MAYMELKDTTLPLGLTERPTSGPAELELQFYGEGVAGYDHTHRDVTYRTTDTSKLNPCVTYTLSLSQIRGLCSAAYSQGALTKQKEISKQLQTIFGLKGGAE